MDTDLRGSRYRPQASVPYCNGDTLVVDGTPYRISAVTRTGLVNVENPDGSTTEWGEATFEAYLTLADEVTVSYE